MDIDKVSDINMNTETENENGNEEKTSKRKFMMIDDR